MRKFIHKLFLFFSLTILSYLAFGYSLEYIIRRNTENKQFDLQGDWHIKHRNPVDVLFVGNSRTYQMLNIEDIQQRLGIDAYALCQASRGSKILYFKIKTFLEHNKKPQIIFLQCDPYFCGNSLTKGTFNGKISYLTYLFNDNIGINHLFRGEKGFKEYEAYLPLLRYFSAGPKGPYSLLAHLLNLKPYKSEFFKFGNEIESRKWEKSSNWFNPLETKDKLDFKYIDYTIQLCKSNDINIVLVYPPQSYTSYSKVSKNIFYDINNFARNKNIEFWNFNSKEYNDSLIFFNHMHLNNLGSQKYTSQIIDSILYAKLLNSKKD